MRRILSLSLLPVFGALACSTAVSPDASSAADTVNPLAAKLTAMGAKPCESNHDFQCVKKTVKLDHFSASTSNNIDVYFAVHLAPAATRKGMLVTAQGGPGYSGVQFADTYADADPRIAQQFDLVFFDLRGVGLSNKKECKVAAKKYYAGGLRVDSDASEQALEARAKVFGDECIAESGFTRSFSSEYPTSDARFYSTRQAVDDLEDFRVAVGEDKLSLYGLGYGTQFMQTYATYHADHVKALLLDGAIDTTLDHIGYLQSLNRGVGKLLDKTFAECATSDVCAARFEGEGDAAAEIVAAFDRVAAELATAPQTIDLRLESGAHASRKFSRADLDTTTVNALGTPDTRRDLMRAIASAAYEHDYTALLNLYYSTGGINPATATETGNAAVDPNMSDATYFAFRCNDFGKDAATALERAKQLKDAGRALWTENKRVLAPFYADLACAYWLVNVPYVRNEPFKAPNIPVMVLNAAGDSTSVTSQGESVSSVLANGAKVTINGGHSVMFGRENACANKAAADFLVAGATPAEKNILCPGTFVSP